MIGAETNTVVGVPVAASGRGKPGNARAFAWTDENRKKNAVDEYQKSVERGRQSKGRSVLLEYLDGNPITRSEAILAKCADCMCFHSDGRIDCLNPICPLYPWMPYRGKR